MSKVLVTEDYLSNIADSIRAKNGSTDTYTPSQMSTAIDNLPSGENVVEEKDINFWDYDGTLIDSYTAGDFANLSEMPANPSHDGLTADGWNWSLADAKSYVASYGGLDIGQTYTTDDNSTRIYIEIFENALSPQLGFAINGTATIDWGDNSTNNITGTSTSTIINTTHTYSTPGKHMIKINSQDDIYFIGASSSNSKVLWAGNNSSSTKIRNKIYQSAIYKVELGNNARLGNYAFAFCSNLKNITIPKNVTTGDYCFNSCTNLKFICYPNTITTINSNEFDGCYGLTKLCLPNSITTIKAYALRYTSIDKIKFPNSLTTINGYIAYQTSPIREIILNDGLTTMGEYCFYYCDSLTKIIMPKNLTTLPAYTFNNCYALSVVDFSKAESIPTLANTSNIFYNNNSNLKIIVPDALYNTWIATQNWSNYASKIIKASDF